MPIAMHGNRIEVDSEVRCKDCESRRMKERYRWSQFQTKQRMEEILQREPRT